jgi:peptidoglycan/LPS O-acetylase OafA/YrhL
MLGLAGLGLISYSLYLTHLFVLMQWYWFGFTRLHIPAISVAIMTPLSVLFAWVFFRLFERPFMSPSVGLSKPSRHGNSSVAQPQPSDPVTGPAAG